MWEKLKAWFHFSETIFLARLQMVAGALLAAFTSFNFSLLSGTPTWKDYAVAGGIFLQGVVTEYLRKRGAEYDSSGAIK